MPDLKKRTSQGLGVSLLKCNNGQTRNLSFQLQTLSHSSTLKHTPGPDFSAHNWIFWLNFSSQLTGKFTSQNYDLLFAVKRKNLMGNIDLKFPVKYWLFIVYTSIKFIYSEKYTKVLRNHHLRFDLCSNGQIHGGDFTKFCSLLRIYELYNNFQSLLDWKFPISVWQKISRQVFAFDCK